MQLITRVAAAGILLASVAAHAMPSQAQGPPPASGVVAGRVVDDRTKDPISGAVVTLAAVAAPGQTAPAPAQARRGVAITNAEGRFVFRDLPAGTYAITSTRAYYAPGATGRRRPDGPSTSFRIDNGGRVTDAVVLMWRLASIAGAVHDDRGEPVIGVSVWAMRRAMIGGRLALTFDGGTVDATDDRGHYRLSGLLPGDYVVGVRSATQSNSVAGVAAWKAATSGPDLPSGGTPFAGMTREGMESGAINIERTGFEVDGWQVKVSIGGLQPLPGPEGTLLMHPSVYHANARSPADATVVTLAAGDVRQGVDLTLPLVTGLHVSGTLMGPAGPAPHHGVRLAPARPASAAELADDTPVAYSTTDAAGRFVLLGVAPGAYMLRSYRVPRSAEMIRRFGQVGPPDTGPPPPSLFAEIPVTVGASHVDNVALVLRPGARLSGRVVFEGSLPTPEPAQVARISLVMRPLIGTVQNSDTRVDPSGTFETMGYPEGRYHLSVMPPDSTWRLASLRINGADHAGQAFALGADDLTDLVITFTDKRITLGGIVRNDDNAEPAESTVVLMPADVRAWIAGGMSPQRVRMTATAAAGDYLMEIPLPGDYLVVAVPPDAVPDITPDFVARFSAAAVRVSVALGETRTQPLTVRRPR